MAPVEVIEGGSPVVLAQPHSGTFVPSEIFAGLNPRGRMLADTDWHVPQLYDGLLPESTIVRANFSRYVIDANRPPDGGSLYPGQNTTGLVPLVDFEGQPIWHEEPVEADTANRLAMFHVPYHAALHGQLERVRARHGFAILWDCHSIRSELPFLFEGRLPDLSIGTNGGASCATSVGELVAGACANEAFSHVVNARFKGGWTTRHYGRPDEGIHSVQMEIAQRCYLASEQPPFAFNPGKAAPLRRLLGKILSQLSLLAGEKQ